MAISAGLHAQPFFYNEGKHQKAQLAESTAKEIANGSVFAAELNNLDTISRMQIRRVLDMGRVQAKAGVLAFETWEKVAAQMQTVKDSLQGPSLSVDNPAERLNEVESRVKTLSDTINNLKVDSPGNKETVEEIQAHLNTASSILKFAEQLPTENPRFSAAVEQITTWLDTVKSLYDSFATAVEARNQIKAALSKLSQTPEADELRMLRLEIEHLNWIAQNAARRELEAGYVLKLIERVQERLKPPFLVDPSTDRVETTLTKLAMEARTGASEDARKLARDRLFSLLWALHQAAAARAQGGLPKELAELRDTQQEWRYSILRSASRVESTEQAMLQAAIRLQLYYRGGIKPAQLAQLLYNLSGLVSLPVIAAK